MLTGSGQICGACGALLDSHCRDCTDCGEDPLLEGRYHLFEIVGRGTTGVTYRAEDLETGQKVAIKEMAYRNAGSIKALELFTREAEVLRSLCHPGIPAYLDHFDAGSGKARSLYLVQEFLEGDTLAQELAHRRYSDDEVLAIIEELLEVLAYLHGLNPPVIHRDIKPENIMRRRCDGRLVLIDFGSVRDAVGDREVGGSTVAGTFGYMAPEQFRGVAIAATDIYGLGATGVALLTRTASHRLLNSSGALDWQSHVRCGQPIRDILNSMLIMDSDERPDDPSAFAGRVSLARTRTLRAERARSRGGPTGHDVAGSQRRPRLMRSRLNSISPLPIAAGSVVIMLLWVGGRVPSAIVPVLILLLGIGIAFEVHRRKSQRKKEDPVASSLSPQEQGSPESPVSVEVAADEVAEPANQKSQKNG